MLRKLSAVSALVVIFAFLFVSVAYACSGVAPMGIAIQNTAMDGDMAGRPCSGQKKDICKSVRDSILSIQPSVSQAEASQQSVVPFPFSNESLTQGVISPLSHVIDSPFHPVFKLPLTLSYLVLRI